MAICNAANEVAVADFLEGNIRFTDIPAAIESALEQVPVVEPTDLAVVELADNDARAAAQRWSFIEVSKSSPGWGRGGLGRGMSIPSASWQRPHWFIILRRKSSLSVRLIVWDVWQSMQPACSGA